MSIKERVCFAMFDDDEGKKKKSKANVELSYTNDMSVVTGSIENFSFNYNPDFTDNSNGTVTIRHSPSKLLNDMRQLYVSGTSTGEIYNDLKTSINDNKDNPQYILSLINNLLDGLQVHYDHGLGHENIGRTPEEMLDRILKAESYEEVSGFVCKGIHEFAMGLLHDCGLDAATFNGEMDGVGHTTLMYQLSEGKYVYNNYNENMVIEAPTIMDAISTIYKYSPNLGCWNGEITIYDAQKSYTQYMFRDIAAFGNEFDKRDYNNITPFNTSFNESSPLYGKVNFSRLGNVNAQVGKIVSFHNARNINETEIAIAYNNSNESASFAKSNSAGIKVVNRNFSINSGFYTDARLIFNQLKGTKPDDLVLNYENIYTPEGLNSLQTFCGVNSALSQMCTDAVLGLLKGTNEKTYNNLLFRGVLGWQSKLYESNCISIDNALQMSDISNHSFPYGYVKDFRYTFEDYVRINNQNDKTNISSYLGGGLIVDYNFSADNGTEISNLQRGSKLNFGLSAKTMVSDDFLLGLQADGFMTNTKSVTEQGLSVSAAATYTPSQNGEITMFGRVGAGLEMQQLDVGSFNEQTQDKTQLEVQLGAELQDKYRLSLGYTRLYDYVNPTKNNSVINFNFGVNF